MILIHLLPFPSWEAPQGSSPPTLPCRRGVVSGKSMGSVSTQTHFESWLCHWPAAGPSGHLTSPHTPIFTSQMSKLYLLNLGELYSPVNVTWLVLNKQRTPLMRLTFVNTQEIRLAWRFSERVTQPAKIHEDWDFISSCNIHLPKTLLTTTN